MARILQFCGLLLLSAAAGICDQGKERPAPPEKKAAPPRKGGGPAGVNPKQGPRINNPASPAARLYQMTPEERERAIEQLPPAQQVRVRNQLKYFDSLPRDQQEIMIRRTERLNALSPQQRRAFLQQLQHMNQLPPDRQQAVRAALRRLQVMPDERRVQVLNSDQLFRLDHRCMSVFGNGDA